MGARLLYFHHEWDTLTTDAFVRSVVRDGYRIELDCLPTLSPVPIPMRLFPGSEKAKALGREIASLLDKQATLSVVLPVAKAVNVCQLGEKINGNYEALLLWQ